MYWWIFTEKIRNVDFTREVSCQELGTDPRYSSIYMSSTKRLVKVLKKMDISSKDAIVDLGCGKGKAMLWMSKFNFKTIYGIELSEELFNICNNNIKRLNMKRCHVINCDTTTWSFPDEINYIYMFNPFSEVVLRQVMENLYLSLEKKPRVVTFIYLNPVCHEVVIERGIFKPIYYWKYFQVYRNI